MSSSPTFPLGIMVFRAPLGASRLNVTESLRLIPRGERWRDTTGSNRRRSSSDQKRRRTAETMVRRRLGGMVVVRRDGSVTC